MTEKFKHRWTNDSTEPGSTSGTLYMAIANGYTGLVLTLPSYADAKKLIDWVAELLKAQETALMLEVSRNLEDLAHKNREGRY